MLDFSKNYFELFGIPQAYLVDKKALAERYLDLQRLTHPDRHANADDARRRLAAQSAARVNEAYETLKDPILRGKYLLGLMGVTMTELGESTRDSAFLMEQMEMREALEEARDKPDPYAEVAALGERVERQITSLVARMAIHFETPDAQQLEAAREILRKMQFLQRLLQEVERVELELDERQ